MKKRLCLLLTICCMVVSSFTACGTDMDKNDGINNPITSDAATTDPTTVSPTIDSDIDTNNNGTTDDGAK